MGIKCSLLGHAFEEGDVERERTEQGDEVVTVVREVERCARCGEERVVSENTEVTAVVEPDEVADDADADAGEAMSGIVDRADDEGGTAADAAAADPDAGDDEEFEPPEDPAEEDAEILDDDPEPSERDPGQWPDDDEPFDPDGLAGEEPEPAVEAVEGDDEPEPDPEPTATEEPRATLGGVESEAAEYVCPDCGYTTEAATSSLREGDACPDCGAGWLRVERNR